jgi:hypothetical protein
MEPTDSLRIQNSPPSVPILNEIDPVHVPHFTSLISILILSSHLRLVSCTRSHIPFHCSVVPDSRPVCMIRNMFKFLWWGIFSTSPNPQAGGPHLVGCPWLLIQYNRSYPPYLQAVPPSATWGRAMPWWQGPTYHCDRDPLITVTGTHLSLWQENTYHWEQEISWPYITNERY